MMIRYVFTFEVGAPNAKKLKRFDGELVTGTVTEVLAPNTFRVVTTLEKQAESPDGREVYYNNHVTFRPIVKWDGEKYTVIEH